MPLDPAKIRARRLELGLTQAGAAARADMLRSHWAKIESGTRDDPSLSTAERIAEALKVRLDAIRRPA